MRLSAQKRTLWLAVLLVLVALPCAAGSVRLRVDVPRGQRTIGVGDRFYISMEVSDLNKAPDKPADVPGAKVLYFERTGTSSRMSNYNGKVTQSFSYNYTLTLKAEKEGEFTFGPVTVDGVQSNKVTYTIGAQQARAQAEPRQSQSQGQTQGIRDQEQTGPKFIGKGDGNLYLRAAVSKTTAYEQEALVYTVKLYTTYDAIKFIGATSAPKFDGFVVEESKDVANQLTYETVNGKSYATAVIARYIIFPQMPGQLKVTGNTYTVSVDAREYYHDPFWGTMAVAKPLQLNVTPNDLTVNAVALPSPKPDGFSGAVGTFKISSELPQAKYETNQASAINYTVSGTGNIKYVTLPDLNALYPSQLEVFTPTTDVNTHVGSTNVSGTVRFDYSFMPLETGTFRIPDVVFVYFNPATAKYEKSVAKGYTVTVGAGAESAKSQTKSRLALDTALKADARGNTGYTLYVRSVWYWLLCYALPLCVLCGVGFAYRSYIRSHADMSAVRSRKANKMARRRLKKAAACLRRNDLSLFYDEMLAALWGYAGDRLKMPTSELNRDNIKTKLIDLGVDEQSADRFIALLDECEFAKYAPAATSESPSGIYEQGVQVINGVEESLNKKKS